MRSPISQSTITEPNPQSPTPHSQIQSAISESPIRNSSAWFFGGKGGVGKTTCAAATAVHLARTAGPTLVISVDPAHSLGDALAMKLTGTPRSVPRVKGLTAVEVAPRHALARWLRTYAPVIRAATLRGTYLDEEDVDRFLDLALPGIDEVMGLLEIARLRRTHPRIVVDTAPTGHALRLLATPATLVTLSRALDDMLAKHRFLTESLSGGYVPDRHDRLVEALERDAEELSAALRDTRTTRFTLVTLPERLAVLETLEAGRRLTEDGIEVQELIVNRSSTGAVATCASCAGRLTAERAALRPLLRRFRTVPIRELPTLASEPRGVAALARIGRLLYGHASADLPPAGRRRRAPTSRRPGATPERQGNGLASIVTTLPERARLVLFAGKGGVGKTTCAAATAIALAERDPNRRILLLSLDPAHSVAHVLQMAGGDQVRRVAKLRGQLWVRELDAAAAYERKREEYRAGVEALFDRIAGGSRFDLAYDRQVLARLIDLAPPGLDEIIGVLAIMESLSGSPGIRRARPAGVPNRPNKYDTLVLDLAPTGHALRLLETPAIARQWVKSLLAVLLKYRELIGLGELAAELTALARGLRLLSETLRDPGLTRLVAVMRPAELPYLETVRLLQAARRMLIPVGGLIVNAITPRDCAACARVAAAEDHWVYRARQACSRCAMILAPLDTPPVGLGRLRAWSRRWTVDGE